MQRRGTELSGSLKYTQNPAFGIKTVPRTHPQSSITPLPVLAPGIHRHTLHQAQLRSRSSSQRDNLVQAAVKTKGRQQDLPSAPGGLFMGAAEALGQFWRCRWMLFSAGGEEHCTLMPNAPRAPISRRAEVDQVLHRKWKPADAKGRTPTDAVGIWLPNSPGSSNSIHYK